MECPICSEPFDRLEALNQHLDVKHPIPGVSSSSTTLTVEKKRLNVSDGVINNNSASNSRPVTISSSSPVNKTKGKPSPAASVSGSGSASAATPSPLKHSSSFPSLLDNSGATATISKTHWKPETGNDICCICNKSVGLVNGRHHCRKYVMNYRT